MDDDCRITPKPKTVREFFASWYFWKPFLGITIGGIVGFSYYYFIGCTSGSCTIATSPYGSIITGSLFGFFITNGPCRSCSSSIE
ncbi:MAG TPA: hypothetical protein VIH57_15910 [Bacteroidales bacterium]